MHLLARGDNKFQSSRTTCEKPEGCISSYRTSSSAYLMPGDDVTDGISRRGELIAGLANSEPEDLQVVRYFPGQQFKTHLDANTDSDVELKRFAGKHRTATLLVYLNDDFDGGATYFSKINLRVRPCRLAALYWRNMLPDGSVDQNMWHGGETVTRGVKYACNVWLRGGQDSAVRGRLLGMPALGLGKGFEPSLEADGKRFGVPIDRRPYTIGAPGVRMTLERMGQMIREGAISPAMRQFAEGVVRAAGVGVNDALTDKRAAQIMLDYVRAHVRYRPDPSMVEYVQSGAVSLCVPGASMCIPVGDCFPEGTLVLRTENLGAKGNFSRQVPIERLKVDDEIWGLNSWTKVEAIVSKGVLEVDEIDLLETTGKLVSTIRLTSGHYVYVHRDNGEERIRVWELVMGDLMSRPDLDPLRNDRDRPRFVRVGGLRKNTGLRKCWDIQTSDHRVYLPEHDVTVSNCDDLSVALGSLLAAYGIQVKLMKQTYGSDDQEHVLVVFKDDSNGKWLAADPSAPQGTPVGWRQNATKEVTVDPHDPSTLGLVDAPEVEFVGVGRLPFGLGVSITQASVDLANQFEAVVLAADQIMAANPPEYATAVGMYQAAGQVGATTLGPEIDSTDPSGGTLTFTQTAWTINGYLASVNATGSTAADAGTAQVYAHQMLSLYQNALQSTRAYKTDVKATTANSVSFGDALVGTAAVAIVGGVVWGVMRAQAQPRARTRARRRARR